MVQKQRAHLLTDDILHNESHWPTLLGKLAVEYRTLKAMVTIYCQHHHHTETLCDDCRDFLQYAYTRLDRCPYGEAKPTCKICPIHCYKADYKEKSRSIMRYAGPRMLVHHPILAIRHLMADRKPVPDKPAPGASNRHQRKAGASRNSSSQ